MRRPDDRLLLIAFCPPYRYRSLGISIPLKQWLLGHPQSSILKKVYSVSRRQIAGKDGMGLRQEPAVEAALDLALTSGKRRCIGTVVDGAIVRTVLEALRA